MGYQLSHVSQRIDQLSLQPTSTEPKAWKPAPKKNSFISDEAVAAMSMQQLGDWVTQQEKAAKSGAAAQLSLD